MALGITAVLVSACFDKYMHGPSQLEPHTPVSLCRGARPADGDFCLPTDAVLEILQTGRFEVIGVEAAPGGISRPAMLTLASTYEGEPFVFRAKWKPAPPWGDTINNSPRREIAAFAFQGLFLDDSEHVVPPTVAHCFPAEMYEEQIGRTDPQFPGTECVFGLLSYWLENVTDEQVWDADRYRDDAGYRSAMSRLNVFTMLVEHADTREGNLLLSTDPRRPRAFAVDNGFTFDSVLENPLANDWKDLIVSDVPARVAHRLRALKPEDLVALGTVAQFEVRDGILVPTPFEPPTVPIEDGLRWEAPVLQLGLDAQELDGLQRRLAAFVARLDAGSLAVQR